MAQIDETRWLALSPLLDELFALEGAERARRLDELAASDPALGAELEALLARDDVADRQGFLSGQAVADAQRSATLAGYTIGAYTIERELGQGGMGTVWLARRSDGRFEGKAAVKFLHFFLMARGGAERFRREGDILARLAHPHIARLLDAGVKAGQPYLVIEYVEGQSIDAWCDTRALPVKERLRLFLGAADAVAHAHDKLVLHRDLKPSNILVTAAGEPKLLDFGVAKLVEEEARAAPSTELTREAGRAYTLAYAAPEQVRGEEVRTATDVYGLGVLLFRLLTGAHPTLPDGDRATPADRLGAALGVEPGRASEAARRGGEEVARRRGASAAQLERALRGDLDNILARALQPATEARYPTVHALADDIRRHLADQPVMARPERFWYRLGKAARRHRLGFAASGAVLLAVLAGIAGITWQAVRAGRERDRALRALTRSEAVTEFMNLMITWAAAGGATVTIPELVERSEALVESSLLDAEGQAAVLKVLADFHGSFGVHHRAVPLLEKAIARLPPGAEPSLRASLVCEWAFSVSRLGRVEEGRRAVAGELRRDVGDRAAELECLTIAPYLSFGPEEALELTQRMSALLDDERREPTIQPARLVDLEATLGGLQYRAGDNDGADRSYRSAAERLKAMGRDAGPFAVTLRNNWGMALLAAGDSKRALAVYDEALGWTSSARGGGAPPTDLAINRARALEAVGRFDEALAWYDKMRGWYTTMPILSHVYDPKSDPSFAAASLVGRASVLLELGRAADAVRALAEADASGGASPGSPGAVPRQLAGARAAAAEGRPGEAWQAAIAAANGAAAASGPPALDFQAVLLRAQLGLDAGRLDEAARDAEEALRVARRLQGARPHSSLTGRAELLRARVAMALGWTAEAAAGFARATEQLADTVEAGHPDLVAARRGVVGQ